MANKSIGIKVEPIENKAMSNNQNIGILKTVKINKDRKRSEKVINTLIGVL